MTRLLLAATALGALTGLALTFGSGGAVGVAVCAGAVIIWHGVRAVRRDRKRTCWIYCPSCHRDLNGDNESFVEAQDGLARYECATCGWLSSFLLDAPVPIYIGGWS